MILINGNSIELELSVAPDGLTMEVTTFIARSSTGVTANYDRNLCLVRETSSEGTQAGYTQYWTLTIKKNETEYMRDGEITFSGYDARGTYNENRIRFSQGYTSSEIIPVWKDNYFFMDDETVNFSIYNNDNEIFKGLAKMQPGSEGCYVNISKIVRDYLSSNISDKIEDVDELNYTTHSDAYQSFEIRVGIDETPMVTYHYINDWSYDKTVEYSTNVATSLNNPINGHADPRMIIPYTYLTSDNYDDQDFYRDGDDYWTTVTWESNVIGGAFFNASWIGKGHSLTDGSDRFTYYVDYCGDYCLYYRNRHNGYDAFLIEGNVKQTDSFNKMTMSKAFNNTTLDFESNTFNNEITSSYELKTGWLSDREAERLSTHLASSNEVYLHNLKDDKIMPVVLNISSVDYKTYKNQGRQLVSYTLTCNCSQKKHIQ